MEERGLLVGPSAPVSSKSRTRVVGNINGPDNTMASPFPSPRYLPLSLQPNILASLAFLLGLERAPDSARHDYDGDSTTGTEATWDGRGPEPASAQGGRRSNGNGGGGISRFSPWATVVDEDEVEGGPVSVPEGPSAHDADPLDNEQFYESGTQTGAPVSAGGEVGSGGRGTKKGKKDKGIKGLLGHRSRYENQDEPASSSARSGNGGGDRFDRMDEARGGAIEGGGARNQSGGGEEYGDEFEAELNRGSNNAGQGRGYGTGQSLASRGDEHEGPEDAWADSAVQGSEVVAGSRQGTQVDKDCEWVWDS